MASQASPASSNDSVGKEIFLPRPPLPFDCDCERDKRSRNDNIDEDWLPELKDIITGNFHVMIDMTGDSDGEDNTEPSRYRQSDTGIYPTSASPTRLQRPLYRQRLFWAYQPPKAANIMDSESAEIPEIPKVVQVRPAPSGPSDRCDDQDGCGDLAPTIAITEAVAVYTEEDSNVEEQQQNQENEEQEPEEPDTHGGSFPSRRQPKAPILTSAARLPESSLTSARGGLEAVQGYCLQPQIPSPITSPVREVACTESCIDIQDITFLHVEGQRETANGPEYQFAAKIWLQPGTGIPSNLVHVYRRDIARQARLSTLRTRKRMSEEAGVVTVKRCAAQGKVRQA